MHGSAAEREREAKARKFVQRLLAELRLLGYEPPQLRGRTIFELIRMREDGYRHLATAAPESVRAA